MMLDVITELVKKNILWWYVPLKIYNLFLLGTKGVVHTDHATLRFLIAKEYAKLKLTRWVLLLQEFDFKIKDREAVRIRWLLISRLNGK